VSVLGFGAVTVRGKADFLDFVLVVAVMCGGGGVFSLFSVATFIRSRLCFRFKPALLPVFCCSVSSPSRFVFVWPIVSW